MHTDAVVPAVERSCKCLCLGFQVVSEKGWRKILNIYVYKYNPLHNSMEKCVYTITRCPWDDGLLCSIQQLLRTCSGYITWSTLAQVVCVCSIDRAPMCWSSLLQYFRHCIAVIIHIVFNKPLSVKWCQVNGSRRIRSQQHSKYLSPINFKGTCKCRLRRTTSCASWSQFVFSYCS